MAWQIIDIKPLIKNTLKAAFSLVVGPMKIDNWTYHVKDEKSWVNAPAREYTNDGGERQFYPIVSFPQKDRYWKFQAWACKILAAELEKLQPATETAGEPDDLEDDGIPF